MGKTSHTISTPSLQHLATLLSKFPVPRPYPRPSECNPPRQGLGIRTHFISPGDCKVQSRLRTNFLPRNGSSLVVGTTLGCGGVPADLSLKEAKGSPEPQDFSKIMKPRKLPSSRRHWGLTPPPYAHSPPAYAQLTGGGGDRLSNVDQGAVDGLFGLVTVFPQEDIADPLPKLWPQEAILNLLLNDII